MIIRKISATTSTNSHLKELIRLEKLNGDFVLVAQEQSSGRGQFGAIWQSQRGKSLTFSVLKGLVEFKTENQFYISKVVSIAAFETLKDFDIPKLKIKWPNDILSANKKLCGILIENTLNQNFIKETIIGLGVNVNEEYFEDLPKATSMKMSAENEFKLDEVLIHFLDVLNQKWNLLENNRFSEIDKYYHDVLYKINDISVFENSESDRFNGKIKGVSREGKLLVELESGEISAFDLKEIKLLSGL
jgi:BirA family biotin operon repressor/biotin-[acetyl-CoA-carboxylase] ligase